MVSSDRVTGETAAYSLDGVKNWFYPLTWSNLKTDKIYETTICKTLYIRWQKDSDPWEMENKWSLTSPLTDCFEGVSRQSRDGGIQEELVGSLGRGDGDASSGRSRQLGFTGKSTRQKRAEQKENPETSWVSPLSMMMCMMSKDELVQVKQLLKAREEPAGRVRCNGTRCWHRTRTRNAASSHQPDWKTSRFRDHWVDKQFAFSRGKN